MRISIFIFTLCILWGSQGVAQDYHKDKIVVKLRSSTHTKKLNPHTSLGTFQKRFSHIKTPSHEALRHNAQLVDLSQIMTLHLAPNVSVMQAISTLQRDPNVIYAEPIYIYKILNEIPNDPSANPALFPTDDNNKKNNYQYYLEKIKAYEAWEIEKGDANMIIGIIDYGFLTDHEDLIDNLHPDYYDMGGADKDLKLPHAFSYHGVAVSGVAAGTPNNGVGIAGVGYNCRYLPIKVVSDDFSAFELEKSLEYLADRGVKVINMSFGFGTTYSHYLEDLMDYYAINKSIVLVAAAGNSGNTELMYPASCRNVISVGGTTRSDTKWSGSNYNHAINLMAPSHQIRTTYYNCCAYQPTFDNIHSYIPALSFDFSGTSFAAPQVSAAAALVSKHFPTLNAQQIRARLEATADNIDAQNPSLKGLIGQGRLNIHRALSANGLKYLNADQYTFDNLSTPEVGKEIRLRCAFTNLLDPTTQLTATLSTDHPQVRISQAKTTLGAMSTLEVKDNDDAPFLLTFDPSIPDQTRVFFQIQYKDGNDVLHHEYFSVMVRSKYYTMDKNDLRFSFDHVGTLALYEQCRTCEGISTKDQVFAQKGGLMIGHKDASNQIKVSNNVLTYNPLDQFEASESFDNVSSFVTEDEPTRRTVQHTFSDVSSADPIGVEVEQKTFAYSSDTLQKAVLVQYKVKNVSGADLNDLFVGTFIDWDLEPFDQNEAAFDPTLKLAYVSKADTYVGIMLVSDHKANYYGIEHNNLSGDGIVLDDFTREKKYETLTTAHRNTLKTDVAQVLSAQISNLTDGDIETVAFAFVAASNLDELKSMAQSAQQMYIEEHRADVPKLEGITQDFIEVCKGDATTLKASNGDIYQYYDGAQNLLYEGNTYTIDAINSDREIFVVNTNGMYPSHPKLFTIKVKSAPNLFASVPDTLYLQHGKLVLKSPVSIIWTFDNNTQSGTEVTFKDIEAGAYTLQVEFTEGACHFEASKEVWVQHLSEKTIVYPNPVTDQRLFVSSQFASCTWELYDYTGRKVQEGQSASPTFQIQTKGLANGIYILKMDGGEGEDETIKLVVIR